MSSVNFGDLTSSQAATLDCVSDAVALLPLGAIEQHGPHLPLETDTLISLALADAIAERLPLTVVVGPAIAGGLSRHHLGFPGTVTLPEDVLRGSVEAFVDAFTRMGIRQTAVFSAHGGNFGLLARLETENPQVLAFSDLDAYLACMFDAAAALRIDVPETDVHAGALETSLALLLFREKVAPSYRNVTGYVEAFDGWRDRIFVDGMRSLSETGVMGDPSRASEELGRAVFASLVDLLAGWLAHAIGVEETS